MIPTPPAIVFHVRDMNTGRFLKALAQVESGNRWDKIGESGERTCWQIKRIVWVQWAHKSVSFSHASDEKYRDFARWVAISHVSWIETVLKAKQLPVTPDTVATVWRLGIQKGVRAIRSGRMPESAQRVRNIYDEH